MKRLMIAVLLAAVFFPFDADAQPEKMIFAIDIIRHGDRTPVKNMPSMPYDWPQGLGQLTSRGMQQEFQLGVALRKRYMQDNALLPVHYNVETMYVRSTDFDRTLMSAQALLAGLYPLGSGPKLPDSDTPALPLAQQPIPIHTVPVQQDRLFVSDSNPQQYKALLEKYVFTRADWQAKTKELQPNFARWSQLTGITITQLYQLMSIADTLYIRRLYGLPLPEGMTVAESDAIIEAGRWAFTTIYKNPAIGDATGCRLFSKIVHDLQRGSEQKTPLKFILYSAHDSTLLALMSAMRAPLDDAPRYASDLNFAVFQIGSGEYIVKTTFNGQPVAIPACGGTVCKLSQLRAFADG